MASKKKKPNFFEKIGLALGILKREVNVLVLGLDNSGKSTLLTHLSPKKGDITEVAPTVGFSVEGFKMGGRFHRRIIARGLCYVSDHVRKLIVCVGLKFTCFDMSGQSKYRSLWERYYADADGWFDLP